MGKLEGCGLVERESKLTKHQLSKNEQALPDLVGNCFMRNLPQELVL
jgi:hypothetical protein